MAVFSEPAHCATCGSNLSNQFVVDEDRERLVCDGCGRIHYMNPSIVAGTIPVADGRVWLLRRAIEPRKGAWTFPAGYMEMGESVEEAAIRETREEIGLEVKIESLLNVYSRPTMSTVHLIYTAEALTAPVLGREALEFASFSAREIPWDGLAFWTTQMALRDWIASLKRIVETKGAVETSGGTPLGSADYSSRRSSRSSMHPSPIAKPSSRTTCCSSLSSSSVALTSRRPSSLA
ncbi:MAG: hypothetical protein DLM70_06710 [Chloroflexi bacterium]|nr:MAG: hypothetical protein DLM70_06710 [Chloroflexota bacterium]